MADDSEPDILSFAEEAAKQKSKKSGYIYREPAYLPRITLQIVPKADGFNVRMIFFFKKGADAEHHFNDAGNFFLGLPPLTYGKLEIKKDPRENKDDNIKRLSRVIYKFSHLANEELEFLLHHLVNTGFIAAYTHEADAGMVTGLKNLHAYLTARECELPADLFARKQHATSKSKPTPRDKDEPWVVRLPSGGRSSGGPDRAG